MNSDKFTFIDLFAGCGGLSEGFIQSERFEALAHVEWEFPMVKTLRNRLVTKWNHSEDEATKRVIHFDIQKSEELIFGSWTKGSVDRYGSSNHEFTINKGLKGLVGKAEVDLIIGGPPCQAYSIAGRAQDKDSMKFDYRNYLFESFVKITHAFRPKAFIFENVPGMLSARPGDITVTKRIFEAFEEIGYEIRIPAELKKSVYSSDDFGVPQKRRRVILAGVRKDSSLNLEGIYDAIDLVKNKGERKTVEDAISHLPKLYPVQLIEKKNGRKVSHKQRNGEQVAFHEARYHNERDITIFKDWIGNGMNSKSSGEKINFYNDLMSKKSNHAKYRNLEWDRPSPTIVAHLYKDGLMFIHPDVEQARSITIKEAALLQSFPEDFEFIGTIGDCYKMIGNAVPPKMAKNIAIAVAESLNKKGGK